MPVIGRVVGSLDYLTSTYHSINEVGKRAPLCVTSRNTTFSGSGGKDNRNGRRPFVDTPATSTNGCVDDQGRVKPHTQDSNSSLVIVRQKEGGVASPTERDGLSTTSKTYTASTNWEARGHWNP